MQPVYTFFQQLWSIRNPLKLIDLCKESWAKNGFELVVLDESASKQNPQYQKYLEKVKLLPSINRAGYDRACYMRHLAMVQKGGGLMIDYDVINYHFTPERLAELSKDKELVILEPSKVPCAVWGTANGYQRLCDAITSYNPGPTDKVNGLVHVSDMVIIRKLTVDTTNDCIEFGCSGSALPNSLGTGWREAPLVHFSNGSLHRARWHSIPKHEAIQKIKPI